MYGVMLILSISCLFVLIRLVVRSRGSEESPWYLESQVSGKLCPWPHLLPNNILYYHYSMHRFNFDGTQYVTLVCLSCLPCLPLNHLGSSSIALYGFGINISLYPCSNYFFILFMFMSRSLMLIRTWSLTWETRATTRVEWDALGWLIWKASERLPYPKGARAVGELYAGRFSSWFCCDGGQTEDSCKCSSHKL
jgi:hypothetical protein